mmetsp:Transcript_1791/g.3966  ORF Transcript_1791/g.3966 Transcript_1791/m.3966 type:complete len:221 (-) Transcript_1791:1030-1692(-)
MPSLRQRRLSMERLQPRAAAAASLGRWKYRRMSSISSWRRVGGAIRRRPRTSSHAPLSVPSPVPAVPLVPPVAAVPVLVVGRTSTPASSSFITMRGDCEVRKGVGHRAWGEASVPSSGAERVAETSSTTFTGGRICSSAVAVPCCNAPGADVGPKFIRVTCKPWSGRLGASYWPMPPPALLVVVAGGGLGLLVSESTSSSSPANVLSRMSSVPFVPLQLL